MNAVVSTKVFKKCCITFIPSVHTKGIQSNMKSNAFALNDVVTEELHFFVNLKNCDHLSGIIKTPYTYLIS